MARSVARKRRKELRYKRRAAGKIKTRKNRIKRRRIKAKKDNPEELKRTDREENKGAYEVN